MWMTTSNICAATALSRPRALCQTCMGEQHLKPRLTTYVTDCHRVRTPLWRTMDSPYHPPEHGKMIAGAEVGGFHHDDERRTAWESRLQTYRSMRVMDFRERQGSGLPNGSSGASRATRWIAQLLPSR